MIRLVVVGAFLLLAVPGSAQHPFSHPADAVEIRFARSQPVIGYVLRIDAADLSGFDVEMRVRNAPDTFRLAMAAHPEYDDRYWRFVEGLRVDVRGRSGLVTREDSALWRVVAAGGDATIRYRIRLPPPEGSQRAAWRPFLSPTGGLTGGPHAFMYVLGATLAPSHVTVDVPVEWDLATGLVPTSNPRTFFAPTADVLVDSPIFAGRFRSWRFAVDGVPHRVIYWPLPDATPFDTAAFLGGLEGLGRQAVALFGRAPYREYTFVFQDGAYGGLEHLNSATLGAPSSELARDQTPLLGEAAHEFIHTWNLMRIRPAERTGVDYRQTGQSRGLWFSEGLSMFYADLLLRRAGIRLGDSTRITHLERLIERYLFNPGNARISPERASLAEYGTPPGSLGDYDPSVHAQGELLGTMLDLIVRDATAGRRSIDDVMRAMLDRFSGQRGFTGRDVERTVADVCGCATQAFFDANVRGARQIDFDRYLRLIGLRARVSREPALGRDGQPAPDWRIFAWTPPGERTLSLLLTDPSSAWGRAGLHTGDRVVAVNGMAVTTWPEFRGHVARARIGDTVRVEVSRPSGAWRTNVVVTGYDRPVVRIEEIPEATERQRALRTRWVTSAP
ncbi:MAG: PDZ domain-containing protein [Gemmatimonadaceae bacterium]